MPDETEETLRAACVELRNTLDASHEREILQTQSIIAAKRELKAAQERVAQLEAKLRKIVAVAHA